jgi:peptidyl-prolyl cis-trans isomerase SurA
LPTSPAKSGRRARAAGLALLLAVAPAAAAELNRVVLRVNDRIATLDDYLSRLADRRSTITRAVEDPEERRRALVESPEETLREMLDELLLLSRGDQLAVEISDARLEEAVARARENAGVATEEEFRAALAQSGMSEEDLRARLRDNMLFQEVLGREVHSKIEINEEELQRYYREHPQEFEIPAQLELRAVVVLDSAGKPPEEMAALAASIREQILAGKTLEEVAAVHAPQGLTGQPIDLGWVSPRDLDPALAAALAQVEETGVTQPVRGRGGLHLLQVVARKAAHLRPYGEVQDALERMERNRRFRDELARYLRELERQAYIEADPPPEAAGFRAAAPSDVGDELELEQPPAEPSPAPPGPAPEPPPVEPSAVEPPVAPPL